MTATVGGWYRSDTLLCGRLNQDDMGGTDLSTDCEPLVR